MIRLKAGLARTIGRLSRASGRGGGTTLPGRVLLKLDRYGETEALADAWVKLARDRSDRTAFVLNADDPLVADIGRYSGEDTTYFGIDDDNQALAEIQHAHDAKQCRVCGHALDYQRAFVGHLGHYSCPNCGMERPAPEVSAQEISLKGMSGLEATIVTPEGRSRLILPLPGLYNLYNALGAIATARRLGIPVEQSVQSLADMQAVFGRVERIQIRDSELSILLIKNPAGANEVIRTLALEPGQLDLWIALNDRIADGRDISWIWDADFEMLAGRVGSVTCTGTRGPEMALRLKYAGIDPALIRVVDGLKPALDSALAGNPEKLFAMPTYTALLDLRKQLSDQGDAERYWEG